MSKIDNSLTKEQDKLVRDLICRLQLVENQSKIFMSLISENKAVIGNVHFFPLDSAKLDYLEKDIDQIIKDAIQAKIFLNRLK